MRKGQRGDTIIEVMLAVTVFSLLAIGTMTIMNSGIALAQRSLELTLVRQQIDSQAEMLRYVHDRVMEDEAGSYATVWNSIKGNQVDVPTVILGNAECPKDRITNSFALRSGPAANSVSLVADAAHVTNPPVYARVIGAQSQGISIQLVKVAGLYAYDAHIQACWYVPGSPMPATTGTIVRLYDPKA